VQAVVGVAVEQPLGPADQQLVGERAGVQPVELLVRLPAGEAGGVVQVDVRILVRDGNALPLAAVGTNDRSSPRGEVALVET
jgi:hypothetical protein